ncbi:MAG TPA: TonB-dependent receptor [Chryseolinea sp.]
MKKHRWNQYVFFVIMKISLAQFIIAVTFGSLVCAADSSGQEILDKKVSLDFKNRKIHFILSSIEEQTSIVFNYSSNLKQTENRASISVDSATLQEVLQKLFTSGVSWEVLDDEVVLHPTEVEEGPSEKVVFAIQVSGRVVDDAGQAVPGVNVIEKGTTNGTATDSQGKYILSVIDENSVLVFSFIGYRQEERIVGSQSTIDIALTPDVNTLSEVVVIGYGERAKKDLTGAISTMSSEEITKTVNMNPEMAMQGRMAGVFVGTPSGSPFDRPNVQIRGVATWGYAEPLYVIDGIPIIEGGASSGFAGDQDIRSPVNIMSSINPNDIESISVLKDASAAAIYGVRASNGVILITTKRGKTGAPKIEFSAQRGFQNVPKKFKMLNTADYTALYQQSYANNPAEAANLPAEFRPADPAYLGSSPTYDWQSELLNDGAVIEDYSLRVSGGGDHTTYFVSGGFGRTEGSLIENYLERLTLASNVTSKIGKYIETGMNLRLGHNKASDNTGSDLAYVATAPPWQPIYDANDVSGYAPSVTAQFVANPDFDLNLVNPGPKFNFDGDPAYLWGPATRGNVFASQSYSDRSFDLFRTFGNIYLQIEPLKGLKVKGSVNGDYYFNLRKEWSEYASYRFSQTPNNPYSGHDGTAKGSYGERQSRNLNLMTELTLNYNKSFRDHNFDVLLSAMNQESTWRYTDASSGQINYTDPDLRNVSNNPPFNGTFTGRRPQALQGYLARVSYKFKDKYYLDATVRRDGSSVFAPDYRWGTFPSFAAAWRISAENFFQPLRGNVIDDLKIRGGWGELGNKETTQGFAYLSSVQAQPDYSLGSGNGNPFGTQYQGIRLPNYPNFALSWERVRTTNIGFDATLFRSHVTLTAEYYNRYTEGIIQNVSLPPNSGIEVPTDLNIGNVRNAGVEVQLGYTNTIGGLGFNVSGNITTVKNRVETMYRGSPISGEFDWERIQENYPIGYLWGYQVGGIFQSAQEITDWKTIYEDRVGTNNQQPGDMYFVDVNGAPAPGQFVNPVPDSIINNNDRTYLGKTIAGFYYGLNVGLTYKNFDLSIFLQGVGDVQKYNEARADGEAMSSTGANQWSTTNGRWTVENPSTLMPRAVRSDPNSNNRFSSRFIEDGDFLRLKNVQLGYSIPSSLLAKTNTIQQLRLFVSGTNLATFTNWKGIDPENDFVPPLRQVLFGINATF